MLDAFHISYHLIVISPRAIGRVSYIFRGNYVQQLISGQRQSDLNSTHGLESWKGATAAHEDQRLH